MKKPEYKADFLRKASKCRTAQELAELAKSENVELKEDASSLLEKISFQFQELSEEDLTIVAGGMRTDVSQGGTTNSSEQNDQNSGIQPSDGGTRTA